MRWKVLWLSGFLIWLVDWPKQSPDESARITWWLWMASASMVAISSVPRRKATFLLGVGLFAALLIRQLIVYYPHVVWTTWTERWLYQATFSTNAIGLGSWVLATYLVTTTSPSFAKSLAPTLGAFLIINLAFFTLSKYGLFNRWGWTPSNGGLFPSSTVMAQVAAVSLPLIWSWKKRMVFIPLATLFCGQSLFAWIAAWLGLCWLNRRYLWLIIFAPLILLTEANVLVESVTSRLVTWKAVVQNIIASPLGIPQHLSPTYYAFTDSQWVLPHPASDVLNIILQWGIWVVPFLGLFLWSFFKHAKHEPLAAGIVSGIVIAFFQNAFSICWVGVLVWFIYILWNIERSECHA